MPLWGNKKTEIPSTQEFLSFAEIHEGVAITKKGELRVIMMASSINFSLKSEQEQNAIVFAYQNFLNSLNFPVQIVMQSKKLDLSKYLVMLNEKASMQTNELLRMQTMDYTDFIQRLINIANIMDKKFFVVIPYMPPVKIQPATGFFKKKPADQKVQMTYEEFKNHKVELEQRVQVVQAGLNSIGVRTAKLSTQHIIELFYGIYNPEESVKEKITAYEQLTAPMVKSETEKEKEKEQEKGKDESTNTNQPAAA